MRTTELKQDLIRKLDALDPHKLKKLYGKILNLINSEDSEEEWDNLSTEQQTALKQAEELFKKGHFISNEQVLAKVREVMMHA